MKAINKLSMQFVALALLFSFTPSGHACQEPASIGKRVYVMLNRATGNTIAVFNRTAEGTLNPIGEFSTGGLGSGPGELPAPFPRGIAAGNPLTAQDNLVLTDDGRFLLAVNAGSNDFSVLAITDNGLELVDRAPSRGNVPVSIAQHGKLVYVINEGELSPDQLGLQPSMTGYFIDEHGRLTPIPNSFRVTGGPDAQPGDILFSPDGRWLIITDKFAETFIHVLQVDGDGTTHEVGTYVANNPAPLGAAFIHRNILAVTEANARFVNGQRAGVPNGSTVSTYHLTDTGTLEPISVAVRTEQTVGSYVRFTPGGLFAYVTDKGSGALSSFTVSPDGELALLESAAAPTGGFFSEPIDEDITADGQFLYLVSPMAALGDTLIIPIPLDGGAVKGYRIGTDGSLTPVATVDGLPISTVGIVAR